MDFYSELFGRRKDLHHGLSAALCISSENSLPQRDFSVSLLNTALGVLHLDWLAPHPAEC